MRLGLECGGEVVGWGGGWGGRSPVDMGSLPRVTRRRWEDRGRRRRLSTRFTIWTVSPAISVNAVSFYYTGRLG